MTNVREDMEKMRNLYTVAGSVIEAATMKNNLENPQKKKNEITTSGYLSEESESTNSKRYMYLHVYCKIIYNRQEMETT